MVRPDWPTLEIHTDVSGVFGRGAVYSDNCWAQLDMGDLG